MTGILNTLIGYLETGSFLSTLLILPFVVLFIFKQTHKQLESFRNSRIRHISSALSSGHLDPLARKLFEEEIVRRYCAYGLGIRVGKSFREALLEAHRQTEQQLDFFEFKNALSYIRYDESGLRVRITCWDKFWHRVQIVSGWVLAAIGALFWFASWFLAYFPSEGTPTGIVVLNYLTGLLVLLICVGTGGMLLNFANSYDSALRVKVEIRKVENANRR